MPPITYKELANMIFSWSQQQQQQPVKMFEGLTEYKIFQVMYVRASNEGSSLENGGYYLEIEKGDN